MLESNISVKINENTQTHWNLSHRHRARDLYSKPKRYTLCFFYEALCGWGEPKNNLHNTVEKKLIPQPHLLLWVRLLIYRFMTGCVSTATSLHMCVCHDRELKRWLCRDGRGAIWQIISSGGRLLWNSPILSSLQQPLQPVLYQTLHRRAEEEIFIYYF